MSRASGGLASLLALSVAGAARAAEPEPLALVGANVVSVRDGKVTANATVVLRGGRIESVGTGPAPAGARVLELKGRYLLPGLVDAHTHVGSLAPAKLALESGVTTVRSSGAPSYADVGLRELARKGAIAGPDVLASGYHVRPRIAEDAFLGDPGLSDLMSGVDTADEIRRMVRANLSHGVDWIKVLATERAGTADTDPRKQVYTEAELRAAVEEAAQKGVPVQAHAHGEEGALAAVRAGVRSIEHGTYLSRATLELMKEKGTYLVPTYTTVVDLTEAGGDYDVPALRIRGAHMLPRLRQTVQTAHKIGVRIVTGADTGYGPNSLTRIAHEVAAFVELGMTPLEAVRCATSTAAEMLRLEKSIGAVEAGFEADLIAVEANPLENVRALQDPLLVVSNGRVAVERLGFAKAR
jgi:imidazolonepropionase-like amidohydrolase